MTSRILAAVVAVVVAGWAVEARAQQGSASSRKARTGHSTSALRATESSEEDSGTRSADPGASRDPFDSAEEKLKAAEKAGGTSKSPGESDGDPGKKAAPKVEKATFGAGCFWHVEAAFEWLPGVKSAVSGYAGGSIPDPDYDLVHSGLTGHAEVVQVTYDPSVISYEQLLKVFWSHHDPTQLNRQGPDVGTQYRSVIYFHTRAQRDAALKSYRALTAARAFPGPIVTQLLPMGRFYRAEDYHQNYYGGKDATATRTTSRAKRSRKPPEAPKAMMARPATGAMVKPSGNSKDVKSTAPVTSPASRSSATAGAKPES
jgi:peptide-methionine (S)-S-oxide reductase